MVAQKTNEIPPRVYIRVIYQHLRISAVKLLDDPIILNVPNVYFTLLLSKFDRFGHNVTMAFNERQNLR